jgi:hypothetical protein
MFLRNVGWLSSDYRHYILEDRTLQWRRTPVTGTDENQELPNMIYPTKLTSALKLRLNSRGAPFEYEPRSRLFWLGFYNCFPPSFRTNCGGVSWNVPWSRPQSSFWLHRTLLCYILRRWGTSVIYTASLSVIRCNFLLNTMEDVWNFHCVVRFIHATFVRTTECYIFETVCTRNNWTVQTKVVS